MTESKTNNNKLEDNCNILVLDTSTTLMCLGLWRDHHSYSFNPGQQESSHADYILLQIEKFLSDYQISISDLDYIGVGIGPGSFIGVRTAVTIVQGLAYGLKLPVVAVPTLQIIAQHAHNKYKFNKVTVVVDARLNELYAATYIVDKKNNMLLQGHEELCSIDDLDSLEDGSILIGDAVKKYSLDIRYPNYITHSQVTVDVQAFIDCVSDNIYQGRVTDCFNVKPLYVRNNVAQPSGK